MTEGAGEVPIGVNITTEQWMAQLAHAWELGHLSLCRRHGRFPFEACRNPYRATTPEMTPTPLHPD